LVIAAVFACTLILFPSFQREVSPLTRVEISDQEVRGISGLARSPDGTLWAVGERDRQLLALSPSDGRTISRRTIDGVDRGVDLESMAWLGESRIAIGTEAGGNGHASDTIYIVEIETEHARVIDRLELPYDRWGMTSHGNAGIEGLCHAGSTLLTAIEAPVRRDGKQLAAIGRYDMERGTWTALWVERTTAAGKLSALDCRVEGDRLDVLAVERHYLVSRLLRFAVPMAGGSEPIVPEMVLDLAPYKRYTDNFEGIVRLGDESAALIIDNDSGGFSGPNALFRVVWGTSRTTGK
jgi:hypothetical protein